MVRIRRFFDAETIVVCLLALCLLAAMVVHAHLADQLLG